MLCHQRLSRGGVNQLNYQRDPPGQGSVGLEVMIYAKDYLNDRPYQGRIFFLTVHFPIGYSFKPPKIVFTTKHGSIYLDTLQSQLSPALTASNFSPTCSLLCDPNSYYLLVTKMAHTYKADRGDQYPLWVAFASWLPQTALGVQQISKNGPRNMLCRCLGCLLSLALACW